MILNDWLSDDEYLTYCNDNPPLKRAKMLAQIDELKQRLERHVDFTNEQVHAMTHKKMDCPHCGGKLEVYESEYGNKLEKA
jgi:hypothetical protein